MMFTKIRDFFAKKINDQDKHLNRAKINLNNPRNIQILPMDSNTNLTDEIREAVYKVFEKYKIVNDFFGYEQYFIKVSTCSIKHESLIKAHNVCTNSYFYLTEVLPNLPHQNGNPNCPDELLRVGLECIKKYTPNMGSYWGYEGYYLSLLVDISDLNIWDARGIKAS